jgi:tetratricopeptide (TPR) repeat protein
MKKKKPFNFAVFVSAWLLSFLVLADFVQAQNSVIRGLVTDENGQAVKDAIVVFQDISSGFKYDLKTDKKGKFVKVGIPPGLYHVTVGKEGYVPFQTQSSVDVLVEEEMTIKLKKYSPKISEDDHLTKGIDSFNKGHDEEALAFFKKVIEKFPSSFEGYNNLGLTYLRMKNIAEATVAFQRAIEVNPQVIESYLALGECYYNAEKNEEAEKTFSQAITLRPDHPKPHYSLGIVSSKMGKSKEAFDCFEKTFQLDPKHASACYQAALAAVRLSDFPAAIKYFETFLKLEPDAPEAPQIKSMIEKLKKHDGGTLEPYLISRAS